jgi:hypothetical protein
MDIRTIDTSDSRVRQLRDEPQSGRYPTREYQQRQPSLERGAADQTDLKNVTGKSVLRAELRTTWDRSAQLTEDSHINSAAGIRRTRLAVGIATAFVPTRLIEAFLFRRCPEIRPRSSS